MYLDGECDAPNLIENRSVHYIKKCLLHQVLIQQNMYIVVLDKISYLQVKIVAIVTLKC